MRHLVLLAGVALVAGSARAATYPVNACVATKQKLAAGYCAAALGASEKWETSQDAAARDAKLEAADAPDGSARDAAEDKARAKFADAVEAKVARCPTTATAEEIESLVDGIRDRIVRDTTISPNVDDAQFTTITPSGPIAYLGKTLHPTCIKGTPYSFFVKRGS